MSGPYGLLALHAGSHGDVAEVLENLGRRFSITEVSVKAYPCCGSTHAVIDGVVQLRREKRSCAPYGAAAHSRCSRA